MSLFLHYLSMPYLLAGIELTLEVTALGLGGGLILGLILAGMQLSRFWLLAAIARAYTVIFRGTPLILQMVFAYDALPHMGIKLPAVLAAGLALACNEAPFIAEMLRAGVLGVDRGQVTAGQALGMTPSVLMRRVIAPQAIRTMIPAFGNEAVSALKNSSLASVIAVQELTLRSTQLASSTFDFFSIFFASGLLYLVLTTAISVIQLLVEWWLDLDRTTRRERKLADYLPWRRVDLGTKFELAAVTAADPEPAQPAPGDTPPLALTREERARRAATIARNNIAVETKDLTKSYGGQKVLNGLDLTVRVGEVVALLGPSGSGKSTLLRCINHLENWDAGTVRVGGRRLGFGENGKPLSPRAIANERASVGVGMVFQQFNLFAHLSAKENIAGPLRWVHGMTRIDADRRAAELLDRVGLSHRADALPRHLSGGQQQRVAIARALAPNPSVLLLDEPTSALDPELVNEVLEVIRRLAIDDGLTMIISTHQIRFADEVADRVAFLSGGTIVEEGPAHEVLSNPRNPLTARFLSVMEADKAPETVR
ncbi:amino acid ABC transporter permease/ATP-binding protein [Bradyrhizobium sp. IC3069]|uniref:amino acid ABC transporter permease/ATP-binding protein n=1 Tax=Bradyrhizobium TaxID=374 RepID=UPI001CD78405|nr:MULTISPECIES: amino acid ABC transporter permease/ATP-binding protein [unclassified Bradyrhizobium]MCA1360654.1 amino acid ABC transporter permease/ATP-binding protein [Bradyrhizobium sp. IC4059]MCA1432996.1 amino acid ABC transporter permease/ATP-binding protein [Bradyrhizobium sp. BRP20]MCA1517145.1 amino acid ABC transporter permease/ATP-binding protein [Bradyrhizobium sp. IC3069]UWU87991.1 amino acid ABC transporter permease/ATP-binding protein [Bradyrhizobium sp. CB1024]